MLGKIVPACSLVVLAAGMTACGGGGGGGGGGGTSTPAVQPPPPVSGPPAPQPPIEAPLYPALELTAANAPEALAIALRGLEEAPPIAAFAVSVIELIMRTGPTSFGSCPRFPAPTGLVATHFDFNADRAISSGDVVVADVVPCTGSAGTLVMRPTLVDVAAQRFEARIEFKTESESGDGAEGAFDLVTTFAGAARVQTLANLAMFVAESGETTYVTDARIEVGAAIPAPQFSYGYEATISSDRLGRSYRLTTPTALSGPFNSPPAEGEIVLEGFDTRARITPAADLADRDDMADLAVAPAGGQYGATTPLPWARVLRSDNLFRWFPNTRPRITRLEITPSNPNRLDTLVPSYDAVDHDGDTLHVFALWTKNGVRLPQPSPTLPPGDFVRGDVIELMIQAQDAAGGVGRRSITFTIGNAPPSVTAAVTPVAPLSIQDLALSSSATDADGDPLATTYAWAVNGSALDGQHSTSLSHTAHAKNDVVTGVVSVSDGFTTTTAEASVTILDTPGTVAVPLPPVDVERGEVVSFTAVASDYDGDDTSTKDFMLVYGPAGMTVDPDTGVVSWPAQGPMFERALRVNYGIGIDEPGSSIATGSLVVTDPDHVPPLARGIVGVPSYDGLHIADLDGDGGLEMLVASDAGIYELRKAAGPGYVQTWADFTNPGRGDRITGVSAEDVDGDGFAEIFVASHSPTIVQYGGVDRSLARRVELPVPPKYVCIDLEVADLDRDGASEVVCLAADSSTSVESAAGVIVVLSASTLDVVAQLASDIYGGQLAVGNVDDDSALEIVTAAGHVFDGVAALGSSSLPQWRFEPRFGWPIAVGDIDGDGVAEIVGVERVAPISGLDGTVRAFDARTEQERWSFATPNPGNLLVADVTGDAIAEILVGHGLIGDVTAHRQTGPTTTSALFTVEFGDNSSVNVIAAGDLDGDTDIEIVAGGWSDAWFGIASSSPTPQMEWTFDDVERAFGFLGGEELGDELAFLVGASGGKLRLARFDTADGDISFGGDLGSYGDLDAAFAIVDYDDDGSPEALLAAEDQNNVVTRVLAYDPAADAIDWSTTGGTSEHGPADVAHADFTGDGRDELVVLTDAGGLRVYEVGAGSPLYEHLGSVAGSADVAVANLDGVGMPEILATMDDRVVVFSPEPTGFSITATSAQFLGLKAMEVTDIDGDGAIDVFVLYGNSTEPARLARLDRFLLLKGEATLVQWASDMTTERSSSPRKNLVFWSSSFFSDVFAADPVSGAEIWRAPQFHGFIGPDSVRYHDFANDGNWSISVGATPGVTLTR